MISRCRYWNFRQYLSTIGGRPLGYQGQDRANMAGSGGCGVARRVSLPCNGVYNRTRRDGFRWLTLSRHIIGA